MGSNHSMRFYSSNRSRKRGKTHPECFLDSDEGREFIPVFRQLRLTYMGNHKMDMEMQIKDRIIPDSWMLPIYRKNWHDMLAVDFGSEIGPLNVSLEDFEKHALRCGRIIELAGSHHVWRWTGFHMGLDLILTFDNFQLSIKRNQMSSPNNELQGLLSHAKRRRFFYKVNVASLNKQEQPVYLANSGVKKATLMMNQSTPIFDVDKKKATFPLLLSLNFLLTQPSEYPTEENELVPDNGPDIEDVQGQA
ncbi:hypothetical protein TCAL_14798 [Tigriopus californicus]|uniref:Uncharacterized protein n=1 Tax=Tigriopus californicus TaxID=6832 RepID=A0A553PNQ1_TIGCA|nr:hypothetical protein TCAL_14798 [Tigriopus californicus]